MLSRLTTALLIPLCMLSVISLAHAQRPPRVALWDPEKGTRETRFKMDFAFYDRVAAALRAGGVSVDRLTTEQVADPAVFSAAKYDALMSEGNTFPRADIRAYLQFLDEGGVLVALAAQAPYLICIEPEPDGAWTYSPKQPLFAWQIFDILDALNLKYIYAPAMHDQGMNHTATSLLKRYLPDVPDILNQKLPSRWFVPRAGDGRQGEVYPLVRSHRFDGADVTPQVFVMQNGARHAIICCSTLYTGGADPALWPLSDKMAVALAQIARDLHDKSLQLTPDMRVSIPEDLPPPRPLQTRVPRGSVDPDGARPVVRWGKFDGSSLELANAATATGGAALPSMLSPGASVQLPVPALGPGPHWLRVRGAVCATGAALTATLNSSTVLSETFVCFDASGAGNTGAAALAEVPAEFMRIAFLPPTGDQPTTLVLGNSGTEPVYFDAVQIEERPTPAPEMLIGLGAGFSSTMPGGKVNIPQDLSRQWSAVRCTCRSQFLGQPDDPKAFDKLDQLMAGYAAYGCPIQLIFEGTPKWAAISPERYADGQKAGRPHCVVPDPQQYAWIAEQLIKRYGDKVAAYELWNETNIQQFWRGSFEEYAEFVRTIAPIIRRLQPQATIISGGMAGWNGTFLQALIKADVVKFVDWFAIHPYAGKSPAWDLVFGEAQGSLFAAGIDKEIYCNESGFTWFPSEWFTPPPTFTPEVQRDRYAVAMGRLLANGLCKLNVFNAGGDNHAFGVIDAKGNPRPAYEVISDYLPLGRKGSRRLDIGMVAADGKPLRGIYAAGATHEDGSATVVLNPADNDVLRPPADCSTELNGAAGSVVFFGKADWADGKVTLTPDPDKPHVGFYLNIQVDPDRLPLIEVSAPEVEKTWSLSLKPSPEKEYPIFAGKGPGVFRVNYRDLLPSGEKQDMQLLFRVYGGKATLDYVHFLPPEGAAAARAPGVPLRLRVPLPRAGTYSASLRVSGATSEAPLTLHQAQGQTWCEVELKLTARSVLTFTPRTGG